MTSVKISETTGLVLDWAAAKCKGCIPNDDPVNVQTFLRWRRRGAYKFTEDSNQLLDLIDSRQIGFLPAGPHRGGQVKAFTYLATQHDLSVEDGMEHVQYGRTIAEACLRTYICSVLGDDAEVAVPDEILKANHE